MLNYYAAVPGVIILTQMWTEYEESMRYTTLYTSQRFPVLSSRNRTRNRPSRTPKNTGKIKLSILSFGFIVLHNKAYLLVIRGSIKKNWQLIIRFRINVDAWMKTMFRVSKRPFIQVRYLQLLQTKLGPEKWAPSADCNSQNSFGWLIKGTLFCL